MENLRVSIILSDYKTYSTFDRAFDRIQSSLTRMRPYCSFVFRVHVYCSFVFRH